MDEEPPAWFTEARRQEEGLKIGARVVVDIGECPHFLTWHGTIEQGATGNIIGLDVVASGRPADHRYWVWFDWPIRMRRSWSYAGHELTVIPPRTPAEIVQETLARLRDAPPLDVP